VARVMMANVPDPAVTVVIPLASKPVRARWLLNALEEQTLPRSRWEALVVHANASPADLARLSRHPLVTDGTASLVHAVPTSAGDAALRDHAWRLARGELVIFTRETCRPDSRWLTALSSAAARAPGSVVQGATRPDPEQIHLADAPRVATLTVLPSSRWGEHTSIAYPRALLQRLGGLDLSLSDRTAETDLLIRAITAGAVLVAEPAAVTYHAVEVTPLPRALTDAWSCNALPHLARRHPEVSRYGWAPRVLRSSHAGVLAAGVAAAGAASGYPRVALLSIPWLAGAARPRRRGLRGLAEAAMRLPGTLLLDVVEVAAMIVGSAQARRLYV
jgi:hypothetical protein